MVILLTLQKWIFKQNYLKGGALRHAVIFCEQRQVCMRVLSQVFVFSFTLIKLLADNRHLKSKCSFVIGGLTNTKVHCDPKITHCKYYQAPKHFTTGENIQGSAAGLNVGLKDQVKGQVIQLPRRGQRTGLISKQGQHADIPHVKISLFKLLLQKVTHLLSTPSPDASPATLNNAH